LCADEKFNPQKIGCGVTCGGGFASFHWRCFGEYLRTDSELQVENVVWKASSTADGKQAER
jgi:hypothetical protein